MPAPDLLKNAEEGFGIIEAVVVMAAVLAIIVYMGQTFVSRKQFIAQQSAALHFQEDLERLFLVTEENSVCEKLNFVGKASLAGGAQTTIAKYDEISLSGMPVIKTGLYGFYRIKEIELKQESIVFAHNPERAKARIYVRAEFFAPDKKTIVAEGKGSPAPREMFVELVVASDSGSTIDSCYGTFSRRIACIDSNGSYNPESKPNCAR